MAVLTSPSLESAALADKCASPGAPLPASTASANECESPGAPSPGSSALADDRASPNPLDALGASFALLAAPPASPAANMSPTEPADKPPALVNSTFGISFASAPPEMADEPQATDVDVAPLTSSGPALLNAASLTKMVATLLTGDSQGQASDVDVSSKAAPKLPAEPHVLDGRRARNLLADSQGSAPERKRQTKGATLRKKPAAAARPAPREASGKLPAAGTSAKEAGAARVRGVGRKTTQKAADSEKIFHKPICKRPAAASTSIAKENRGRKRVMGRVEALEAKHPWGREDRPPPASEEELQSLAAGMIRLRKEAKNFSKPERANATTPALKARAEAMLHIMRNKARIGFGGGFAMASHGLTLSRSAGLAIAKRARKLADDLDALCDPESTPSVLIEEGITLLNAD